MIASQFKPSDLIKQDLQTLLVAYRLILSSMKSFIISGSTEVEMEGQSFLADAKCLIYCLALGGFLRSSAVPICIQ